MRLTILCQVVPPRLPVTRLPTTTSTPIPQRYYQSCLREAENENGSTAKKAINKFRAASKRTSLELQLLHCADCIWTPCASLQYLTPAIKKPAGTKWIGPM